MTTFQYNIDKTALIRKFGKRSNFKAAFAIINNWLAFFILYYAAGNIHNILPSAWSYACYVPISFLIACALRGFDNLTHEGSHNNIFEKPKLHTLLQFLYAFPVFKTNEDYKRSHTDHHHFYIKDKARDPDTQQNIRWGVEHVEERPGLRLAFWLYVGRFLMFYYAWDNLIHNFIPHLCSKKSWKGRLAFWSVILIAIGLTYSWQYFFLGFVIPYFIWLPYIRFITESSKHTNVNLEDSFANSRNNIGWIHQIILHPHNDGFHQMHHFAPSIPFYNLKKAYKHVITDPMIRAHVIESFSLFQTIKQILKLT